MFQALMPALVAAGVIGDIVWAGSSINSLITDRRNKRMDAMANIAKKAEDNNLGRLMAMDIQGLRNETRLFDTYGVFDRINQQYLGPTVGQISSMEHNNFLATLAERNKMRIASLAKPTQPSMKEAMLAQVLSRRIGGG
jgi:hypothetical protein